MIPKYDKYKKTGIDWVGEVPEHWQQIQFKDVFSVHGGNGFPEHLQGNEDGEFPFYKVSDINSLSAYVNESANYVNENTVKEMGWNIIPPASILAAKIGEALKKNHRKISESECIIDNNMIALHPSGKLNLKIAYYLLNLIDFDWYNNPGAVPSISVRKLLATHIYFPYDLKEQINIANHLDKKTAKLDKLIKNKEEQIALLNEIRQIEINTAVTKGLNPNVKMKNSGIDWLCEIPDHWEVKRLKDKVNVNVESLGAHTDPEHIIQYLDISNVDNTGMTGEIQELRFYEAPSRARRVVRNEDVLMSTVRPYLKAIAYLDNVPNNMVASTGFAVMTSKRRYHPRYLYYLVVCHWFNSTINSQSVGASYPAVNNDVLVAAKIIYTPFEEQFEIIKYLDKKIGALDKIVKNLKTQVERLHEIRKIEIYNAVTGKIKVV